MTFKLKTNFNFVNVEKNNNKKEWNIILNVVWFLVWLEIEIYPKCNVCCSWKYVQLKLTFNTVLWDPVIQDFLISWRWNQFEVKTNSLNCSNFLTNLE